MDEKQIYLMTIFGQGDKPDTERLVRAASRGKAAQHVVGINKATPAEVARLMSAGIKVEDAQEG